MVCTCVCVCVSWHTGQSDVPSHICQHPQFIYPVTLSFVDLVTWSESGRCRAPGTPESPVRMWWETRACDPTHSATHTQAQALAQYDLHLSLSNLHFSPHPWSSPCHPFSFDFCHPLLSYFNPPTLAPLSHWEGFSAGIFIRGRFSFCLFEMGDNTKKYNTLMHHDHERHLLNKKIWGSKYKS